MGGPTKNSASAPPSYAAEWQEFRKRRRMALTVFFVGPPALLLASLIWQSFHLPAFPILVLVAVVFLAFAVTTIRFAGWRCPRCRKPFLAGFWFLPIRRCLFCKLPIWFEPSDRTDNTYAE